MLARNSRKLYVENAYYHIYNRGVERRVIFEDGQDYKVFLNYLKEYLSPPPDPKDFLKEVTFKGQAFKGVPRLVKNYSNEVELIAFCLMPNHFHFLARQLSKYGLRDFIQSLLTRYTAYFNKRYNRVGGLFQGRYKAVIIEDERQLLVVSRYIHRNPLELKINLLDAFSSYADYLDKRRTFWLRPEIILKLFDREVRPEFKDIGSYEKFVEGRVSDTWEVSDNLKLD